MLKINECEEYFMERKQNKLKQSPSFTEESAGFDCGQIRLWKNNAFAESSSDRLVGLSKTFCFRKEFVSTRIQNFEKRF